MAPTFPKGDDHQTGRCAPMERAGNRSLRRHTKSLWGRCRR
jgi:hypothetical protein